MKPGPHPLIGMTRVEWWVENKMMNKIPTFEESIGEINDLLAKRKSKWNLTALGWIDFEDVEQIIRIHIHNKWHKYDSSKLLGPWINQIITNQIKNLVRNYYGNYSRPCLKCPANEGGNLCAIYQKQCGDCPIYKDWENGKKHAYDTKLPVSLNLHEQEVFSLQNDSIDVEKSAENLHARMEQVLKPFEFKVYKCLYIDNLSEEETANIIGYKITDKNKKCGCKHIRNIKKTIIEKVKKALARDEVDIV